MAPLLLLREAGCLKLVFYCIITFRLLVNSSPYILINNFRIYNKTKKIKTYYSEYILKTYFIIYYLIFLRLNGKRI